MALSLEQNVGLLTGHEQTALVATLNVEGNFDLWDTTWCRWDAGQLELAEDVVVLGHGALALEDLEVQ